jgi:hypothetical protein
MAHAADIAGPGGIELCFSGDDGRPIAAQRAGKDAGSGVIWSGRSGYYSHQLLFRPLFATGPRKTVIQDVEIAMFKRFGREFHFAWSGTSDAFRDGGDGVWACRRFGPAKMASGSGQYRIDVLVDGKPAASGLVDIIA